MSTEHKGTRVAYSAGEFLHDAECNFHAAVEHGLGSPEGRELTALSTAASLLVIAQLMHRGVVAIEGIRLEYGAKRETKLDEMWVAELRHAASQRLYRPGGMRDDEAKRVEALATKLFCNVHYYRYVTARGDVACSNDPVPGWLDEFIEGMKHLSDEGFA